MTVFWLLYSHLKTQISIFKCPEEKRYLLVLPESSSSEGGENGCIDLRIVFGLLLDDEAVRLHEVDAEDGGEVLAVDDVLHLADQDAAGLLVNDFILKQNLSKNPLSVFPLKHHRNNVTNASHL